MKRLCLLCWIALTTLASAAEWKIASPGYTYEFPKDHWAHRDFQTEWWYFTGNVSSASGREFGYQLTFFRQGVNPDHAEQQPKSRFVVPDFYFAHFAVTDVTNGKYRHFQLVRRGAFGEAGAAAGGSDRIVWIENWEMKQTGPDAFQILGASEDVAIDLRVRTTKAAVIHGENGISQKAEGAGRASHYYSFTRMETTGLVTFAGEKIKVNGLSWMDREWATNQLGANQVGWDWFSIQFDTGEELMLYQMRLRSGGKDPMSSGTCIAIDGTSKHLRGQDFDLVPGGLWKSGATGISYPLSWKALVPTLNLELQVDAAVKEQELAAKPITYWEGSIRVRGTRNGNPVSGKGYLELTGYGSPLEQLRK